MWHCATKIVRRAWSNIFVRRGICDLFHKIPVRVFFWWNMPRTTKKKVFAAEPEKEKKNSRGWSPRGGVGVLLRSSPERKKKSSASRSDPIDFHTVTIKNSARKSHLQKTSHPSLNIPSLNILHFTGHPRSWLPAWSGFTRLFAPFFSLKIILKAICISISSYGFSVK